MGIKNDNPPKAGEQWLGDLRSGMRDDLDGVKREILDCLKEIDLSLGTMSRPRLFPRYSSS